MSGVAQPFEAPADRFRIVEGMSDADRGYVIRTWTDSFHRARESYKFPFRVWKPYQRGLIARVLEMPETRALVAHHDTERHVFDGQDRGPAVLGWIVWTTGRGWPAVHYVFTRPDLGVAEWRRRGVMTELVAAADLGPRVVYTHHGEHKRSNVRGGRAGASWRGGRSEEERGQARAAAFHPRPLDEEIAAWARRRGMTVAYVPLKEWLG